MLKKPIQENKSILVQIMNEVDDLTEAELPMHIPSAQECDATVPPQRTNVWSKKKLLIHHQHIYTPLQNVECNLSHQVFFVESGVYFCYLEAADLAVLHKLAYKVFRFPFTKTVANGGSGSFCYGRVEAVHIEADVYVGAVA